MESEDTLIGSGIGGMCMCVWFCAQLCAYLNFRQVTGIIGTMLTAQWVIWAKALAPWHGPTTNIDLNLLNNCAKTNDTGRYLWPKIRTFQPQQLWYDVLHVPFRALFSRYKNGPLSNYWLTSQLLPTEKWTAISFYTLISKSNQFLHSQLHNVVHGTMDSMATLQDYDICSG